MPRPRSMPCARGPGQRQFARPRGRGGARARDPGRDPSAAMEDVFGRYDTVPTPVKGRLEAAQLDDARWARLKDGVVATARRLGRKPRIMVAKMGQDGHDRGANLVSSVFGDLGFEVVPGPLFQTPSEAAALAVARDVDVVGASSLAARTQDADPELVAALKDAGPRRHQSGGGRRHPAAGLRIPPRSRGAGDFRARHQPGRGRGGSAEIAGAQFAPGRGGRGMITGLAALLLTGAMAQETQQMRVRPSGRGRCGTRFRRRPASAGSATPAVLRDRVAASARGYVEQAGRRPGRLAQLDLAVRHRPLSRGARSPAPSATSLPSRAWRSTGGRSPGKSKRWSGARRRRG